MVSRSNGPNLALIGKSRQALHGQEGDLRRLLRSDVVRLDVHFRTVSRLRHAEDTT